MRVSRVFKECFENNRLWFFMHASKFPNKYPQERLEEYYFEEEVKNKKWKEEFIVAVKADVQKHSTKIAKQLDKLFQQSYLNLSIRALV